MGIAAKIEGTEYTKCWRTFRLKPVTAALVGILTDWGLGSNPESLTSLKSINMKKSIPYLAALSVLLCTAPLACSLSAQQTSTHQFVYGDALPDAPELAKRGEYTVGVRTLELVHKNQLDILNAKDGSEPLYDRPLTVEVWYPAANSEGEKALIQYDEVLGMRGNPKMPVTPFTFFGRATRDVPPMEAESPFPLVIVSHGYVGSRYLMTYLTENLASKGYVVIAIAHTESTFSDAGGFHSTLLNRSKDILFVLDQAAGMGAKGSDSFLAGVVDADHTALIGYSMGGYGALNAVGAAYSQGAVDFFAQIAGGSTALASRGVQSKEFREGHDPRIKAVVAFAPWGMERGVWDAETLTGLKVPTFFVAGSEDDISGYEKGIKAIYAGAVNSDRYLLTYQNARHNIAPNPPPPESLQPGLDINEYYRYAEPSWDERRINNINQHFVTAFLGMHLKGNDYKKYLGVKEDSNEETWTGFIPRSSTGLELLHAVPD